LIHSLILAAIGASSQGLAHPVSTGSSRRVLRLHAVAAWPRAPQTSAAPHEDSDSGTPALSIGAPVESLHTGDSRNRPWGPPGHTEHSPSAQRRHSAPRTI